MSSDEKIRFCFLAVIVFFTIFVHEKVFFAKCILCPILFFAKNKLRPIVFFVLNGRAKLKV